MGAPPCEGSSRAATALHACIQEGSAALDALQILHKMGNAYLTASVAIFLRVCPSMRNHLEKSLSHAIDLGANDASVLTRLVGCGSPVS